MRMLDKDPDELKELVDIVLEERATPEQVAQLAERLKSDPQALDFYVTYTHLHARLLWRFRGANALEREESPASATVHRAKRFPLRWLAVAASVGILLGGGVPLCFQFLVERPAAAAVQSDEVATLVDAVECLWGASRQATVVGTRLACGTVQLVQGACEIAFDSGARMILTGPSVLEIQSRDRAFLRRGTATCRVPKQAIGFVVQTPSSRVVDYGTEFGIRTEESGASQVHTFTGLVRVESSQELMDQATRTGGAHNAMPVLAGQQIQIDADGRTTRFFAHAEGEGFVRSLPQADSLVVSNSYARLVLADRPTGYWRFEETAMNDGSAAADSSGIRRAGSYHGKILSVPGVPGIGGRAARFDGKSALVRVPHHPVFSLNSLSVEFWICTRERWNNEYWPGDAVIVGKDVPGLAADWSIIGGSFTNIQNEGRVIVGIGSKQVKPVSQEDQLIGSAPGINDGVWHHVVWTRDRSGVNRLYVDGVPVSSTNDGGGSINNPMDIEIGGSLRSSIAFPATAVPVDKEGRVLKERSFLDGELDEVAIYDHVLSLEQVNAHYRTGK